MKKILRIVKNKVIKLIYLLDQIIPKGKIIIFQSYIELTDNAYGMYEYFKENYKDFKLVWILYPGRNKKDIKAYKNIKIYYHNEILGIYYALRSKYIFSTHYSSFDFLNNKDRIKVNLWHGMPLKAIGNLDKRNKKIKNTDDYIIATSQYFKETMSKVFDVKKEKVIITGQPRNDLLFRKSNFFDKMEINKEDYKEIFIWMPTFRNSNEILSSDGKYKENYISIVPFNRIKELNNLLKQKEILLIIKLHPLDILQEYEFEKLSNIIIIKSGDLEKIDEQLYSLLGATDALITDYSSVWIDYEILDKPIFFVMDDYNEYKNTRGLLFEDFINISPYPIIDSYNKFIEFIENYEKIDLSNREVTDRYNKYKDNKSCERIAKYLGIDKN